MKAACMLGLTAGLLLFAGAAQGRPQLTMDPTDVRRRIVEESIRSHGGYCVCPWQKDRKGRRCGARSLYSQPGGYPPQCYARDIDETSVEAWLNEHER
jgi:hypothetical protein